MIVHNPLPKDRFEFVQSESMAMQVGGAKTYDEWRGVEM